MATAISLTELLKRQLLIYNKGLDEYTRIPVEKFIDKTVPLAVDPTAANPDGVPGVIVPVPGGGLSYDAATGQLELDISTDSLRFIGFIETNYQKPDPDLVTGDFYIVNSTGITLETKDWPGIDGGTLDGAATIGHAGTGYRADTGEVSGMGDANNAANPGMFKCTFVAGRMTAAEIESEGADYAIGDVIEFLPNSAGGGSGGGAAAKVDNVTAAGGLLDISIITPGQGYVLAVGDAGSAASMQVDGGSGVGMLVDIDIEAGTGAVTDVRIINQGYGYQDGEVLQIIGSKTGDSATFFYNIANSSEVDVNLGDRVFYTRSGDFTLVPDVAGATAILQLSPVEAEGLEYYFEPTTDYQHLKLVIKEAGQNGGIYEGGLISADDKEKLDNISENAGQGRVWEIANFEEDNYLPDGHPQKDTVIGVPPVEFIAFSERAVTGDLSFDVDTIGYNVEVKTVQKVLENAGTVVSPRTRGVVFLAEEQEIEDRIDDSTFSVINPAVVMNAEDTITNMTQKRFDTLPKYDTIVYTLGTVAVDGPAEVEENGDGVFRYTVTGGDTPPSKLSVTWTVDDPSSALDSTITQADGTLYVTAKDGAAPADFSVTATVTNGAETDDALLNSSVIKEPSLIGNLYFSTPPAGYKAVADEVITYTVEHTGTATDIRYVVEVDTPDFEFTQTDESSNVFTYKFVTASTDDPNNLTDGYEITVKAYSESAQDANGSDADGNYSVVTFMQLVYPTVTSADVINDNGIAFNVGDTETFTATYEGGANEAVVVASFTTEHGVDDAVMGPAETWRLFEGEKSDAEGYTTNGQLTVEFETPLTNVKFSDYTISAKKATAENAVVTFQYRNGKGLLSGLGSASLTDDLTAIPFAADSVTEVEVVTEFVITIAGDALLTHIAKEGAAVLLYKKDDIVQSRLEADVTFNRPGANKVSGSVIYGDVEELFESDGLVIS